MKGGRYAVLGLVTLLGIAGCGTSGSVSSKNEMLTESQRLAMIEALGRKLYFDTDLSEPAGQSCASCHQPTAGFADPDRELPVSRGVDPAHFGNRNAPTTAYAAYSPDFHYDEEEGLYLGGYFLDGRAPSLKEQAKGPFLNPLEMGNPDAAAVVAKVKRSDYATLFTRLYGETAFEDVSDAYDNIAQSIAAFERTKFFSPFTSKYDAYLAGKAKLTEQEQRGLKLFEDEHKGNCAACHPNQRAKDGALPLFTDFSYDNLGLPKLKENPFYHVDAKFNPEGDQVIDLGLGGVLKEKSELGKFKVPTLRNIGRTAPYMHNGVFTTLEEVVDFYNTRDTDAKWGKPEVAENVNDEELGDLKLNQQEVKDLVAFLKTLDDGYRVN